MKRALWFSLVFGIVSLVGLAGFSTQSTHADIIEFRLTGNGGDGLLPGNVTPPTGVSGSGGMGLTGITFDTATNLLHIDVMWGSDNGFGDLTGEVTMLHLHGPTDAPPPDAFSQTGPLMLTLSNSLSFDNSATGGGVNDSFFVNNSDVAGLLAGRTYINVHTAAFEFGEIRGYLVAIPEPATGLALMAGTGILLMVRRRRR